MDKLRFIDLFAGIGGFRLGFEQAATKLGLSTECVFSSEIKEYAVKVYTDNFGDENLYGDITKIDSSAIPDFDVLLAGFPCQAFSSAGKRQGFLDTRGTLFFEIERILKEKQPKGFILENVEGLVKHDLVNKDQPIGRTLDTIIRSLTDIGYKVNWEVLNSKYFGVPQERKRIFITGTFDKYVPLNRFDKNIVNIESILEKGKPSLKNKLITLLLGHYKIDDLYGKSMKDKRGGPNNIHSWDIELKGKTSLAQRELLNLLMKARRSKKWAINKGITWMDGMPLTKDEIQTFFEHKDLSSMLDDLVSKKYLKLEHPKDIVSYVDDTDGHVKQRREFRTDLEPGYNIVSGKLSFEINKILDPKGVAPTLVATDIDRLFVVDGDGLRRLTEVEQKRLFGFPDNHIMDIRPKEVFDVFGNTVVVNVVEAVAEQLIKSITDSEYPEEDLGQTIDLSIYRQLSLPT